LQRTFINDGGFSKKYGDTVAGGLGGVGGDTVAVYMQPEYVATTLVSRTLDYIYAVISVSAI